MVLYLTVTSLGLVILVIGLSSLQLRISQLVAPYVFVAGALCTAVAVELLLTQLDSGAFWCLLPWLLVTAMVIALPVLRRALTVWQVNHEDVHQAIAARWRHFFAQ